MCIFNYLFVLPQSTVEYKCKSYSRNTTFEVFCPAHKRTYLQKIEIPDSRYIAVLKSIMKTSLWRKTAHIKYSCGQMKYITLGRIRIYYHHFMLVL